MRASSSVIGQLLLQEYGLRFFEQITRIVTYNGTVERATPLLLEPVRWYSNVLNGKMKTHKYF